MESKWRQNIATWIGPGTTAVLFARLLSGPHAGEFLYKFNGTFGSIVPEPAFPGILPSPSVFLGNMGAQRFPWGYDVEPDN